MAGDEPRKASAPGQSKDRDAEDGQESLPSIPEPPAVPKLDVPLPELKRHGSADESSQGFYRALGIAASATTSFVLPILLLALLGYWLDGRLRTSPWLVLAGIGTGFVVGTCALVRAANRLSR